MVFSFENFRTNIFTDITFRSEVLRSDPNKLCETDSFLVYPLRHCFFFSDFF